MTLEENISKYKKIVAAHPDELSEEAIVKTVRLIVMADVLHRADAEHENYEHLSLCTVAGCGLFGLEKVWYGGEVDFREVSDVMQMRIMCDVLTILLKGNQPLAMCFSMDVVKAIGGRVKTTVETYLEFDECEKILDSYASSSFDEELRFVFEQTEELLKGLHHVQVVADRERLVVTSTCVSGLWLPKEYNSSGFEVSTKIPANLKTAEGNIVDLVAIYNFACVMDVLVRAITRTRTDQVACSLFVARIDEMCSLSRDLVPIGIRVPMGVHPSVYRPNHFIINDTIRVMYQRLVDDNIQISFESVRSMIQVIVRYYNARKGVN